MQRNSLILFLLFATLFSSCKYTRDNWYEESQRTLDYENKAVLDSLIKATPISKDTLFLGFTIGMSESDYENHIQKIRNEGKLISFADSNSFTTTYGRTDFGSGYTFTTNISTEVLDKTVTGEGQYFLKPVYNQNGELMKLTIFPVEKWNKKYAYETPNWLETNVEDNSVDFGNEALEKALIDNKFLGKFDYIRKKGNLIIYRDTSTVNYMELKTVLIDLVDKKAERDRIRKQNKDIEF
ncbi:MAG: hypothetical protein ACI9V1_000858 [Spirosomataceae bacterium]|jgi:hypothetical protein